jgi:hypothetical protein
VNEFKSQTHQHDKYQIPKTSKFKNNKSKNIRAYKYIIPERSNLLKIKYKKHQTSLISNPKNIKIENIKSIKDQIYQIKKHQT